MASFRFPQQLLHSSTEPQWLPPTKDETGSRIDELARQEEAFVERTRKQVIPLAPEAIGVAAVDDSKGGGKLLNKLSPPDVDIFSIPSCPVFWDHYRDQVQGVRVNQLRADKRC